MFVEQCFVWIRKRLQLKTLVGISFVCLSCGSFFYLKVRNFVLLTLYNFVFSGARSSIL